jgi:2-polyprenyl-3-methyl-5-hydroxy-6-metoxy-1,4-benzoquinol methylase
MDKGECDKMMMDLGGEKTDPSYWESQWSERRRPMSCCLDVDSRRLKTFAIRKFHHLFSGILKDTKGKRLIEIGCGGSLWLPYFASRFNVEITGVDYSPSGCDRSREILRGLGIQGEIIEADLFRLPSEMADAFDVLVSFGVVEHFADPSACIHACSKLLRHSGKMITVIPNMAGLVGKIQKRVSKVVFDLHVPLEKEDLERAHRCAGLRIDSCDYFMFFNLGVVNTEPLKKSHPLAGKLVWECLKGFTGAMWAMESALPFLLRPNRYTSPHIVCVAEKSDAS